MFKPYAPVLQLSIISDIVSAMCPSGEILQLYEFCLNGIASFVIFDEIVLHVTGRLQILVYGFTD